MGRLSPRARQQEMTMFRFENMKSDLLRAGLDKLRKKFEGGEG